MSYSSKHLKALPKSIINPLPQIPNPSVIPSTMTLDKLLSRKSWGSTELKNTFVLKLFNLSIELVKVTRKLFSLRPCQMVVSGLDSNL